MQESDKEVVEVMVKQEFVINLKQINKRTLFQVRCEPQIKQKMLNLKIHQSNILGIKSYHHKRISGLALIIIRRHHMAYIEANMSSTNDTGKS